MKKFIVSILAILYLSTATGATIHLHYCMGKLADWGLRHGDGSKCGKCGMQKSHKFNDDGCCKDEYKQIKTDNDQKLSESFPQFTKTITEIAPISFPVYTISLPLILSQEFPKANVPPRSCYPSLIIINCVFLI